MSIKSGEGQGEAENSLNPGDIVQFNIAKTEKGLAAINITIVRRSQPCSGEIKSYWPPKFGIVAVDDGGPDAFFAPSSLDATQRKKLAVGRKVSFYLDITSKRRRAIKLVLNPEDQ